MKCAKMIVKSIEKYYSVIILVGGEYYTYNAGNFKQINKLTIICVKGSQHYS